ncbi:uncharacterized protein LOC132296381 [Cornus florida]|uniref:uncharacterized protein LOC132296381 n=1 Tax=Cornus florida TaxID=4283 RepID=UPI0028979EA3|nr:uncharacterized protein LOC132296381 [Cornus florida]
MRWLMRRYGYYWPGMRKHYMIYAKGYIDCQKHGPMQWVPTIEMQLLVKPWPFRGWAMDLIGKINPPSSKGHHWIILATDYFTKWVEAEEYVSVIHNTIIQFLEQHIFHRFGLLEIIVADNGSVFRANEVLQLGIDMKVKMVTSTPYYAQGNGQAEASKSLLPMELNIKSASVALQHNLIPVDYNEAMLAEFEDLDEVQKLTLDHLMMHKAKVMRAYKKKGEVQVICRGRYGLANSSSTWKGG